MWFKGVFDQTLYWLCSDAVAIYTGFGGVSQPEMTCRSRHSTCGNGPIACFRLDQQQITVRTGLFRPMAGNKPDKHTNVASSSPVSTYRVATRSSATLVSATDRQIEAIARALESSRHWGAENCQQACGMTSSVVVEASRATSNQTTD
jgi:hypothetical protein